MPSVISSEYAFSQIAAAASATEQAMALMPSRINVTTPTSVYCLVEPTIASGSATGDVISMLVGLIDLGRHITLSSYAIASNIEARVCS